MGDRRKLHDNRKNLKRLRARSQTFAALPVFETEQRHAEMLQQIDARAAHLEKIDAEVREWEKKTAKAAEAELKSRAAQIASELGANRTLEKTSA